MRLCPVWQVCESISAYLSSEELPTYRPLLQETWSQYSWGRPTVILFVLMISPRTTCFGLIDAIHHFFRDKGHWCTPMLGSPQTVKMLSIVAARSSMTYSLPTPADKILSTYIFPFGGISFPSGWVTPWLIGQEQACFLSVIDSSQISLSKSALCFLTSLTWLLFSRATNCSPMC